MSGAELRAGAEMMGTDEECVLCMQDLEIAYGYMEGTGVCTSCGMKYSIDEEEESLVSNLDKYLLRCRDISPRHLECMRDYYNDKNKPAPLWSYSPFKSIEFEEFSEWAYRNNYNEFAWLTKNEV